ncbi:hypothetical protein [uncultured Eubacterium sp.]|jgi:hypothetical protein|uniref:hypothetical protein n=1 Tax=Eubacterium sp. TaxID=142586 RepID=UPI0025CCE014|nr:hypothetical protein [uncultured Eubacterium sp.]
MKKLIRKIYLVFIIILYTVFCYIYATDGLKIQLANKIQNNFYDYIKYEYSPVSTQLYIIAIIGMIVSGLIFTVCSTYKIYRYIKKYIQKKSLRIIAVLIFLIIVILFLHLCRNYFVNVNMPIGEEM